MPPAFEIDGAREAAEIILSRQGSGALRPQRLSRTRQQAVEALAGFGGAGINDPEEAVGSGRGAPSARSCEGADQANANARNGNP